MTIEEYKKRKRRIYYIENRERINARSKAYYQEHKDQCKERAAKWQAENRERFLELKRAYNLRRKLKGAGR